jgi:hypothetical protein
MTRERAHRHSGASSAPSPQLARWPPESTLCGDVASGRPDRPPLNKIAQARIAQVARVDLNVKLKANTCEVNPPHEKPIRWNHETGYAPVDVTDCPPSEHRILETAWRKLRQAPIGYMPTGPVSMTYSVPAPTGTIRRRQLSPRSLPCQPRNHGRRVGGSWCASI